MGNLKINGNLLMPLHNSRMILGSNGTTDYVDICFKRGAKNNEMYLCGDADGQGGHINVSSTDGTNGLHIKVDRTIFEKEIEVNGLIYSGHNGNTLTLGSINASYCHFQNSANIPFHFNKDVRVQGNLYMGSNYSDLVLSSANYFNYALPYSINKTATIDFNTLTSTAWYSVCNNNTNSPTPGNHGLMLSNFDVGTPFQIWWPDNSMLMYKRYRSNGSWTNWSNTWDINATYASSSTHLYSANSQHAYGSSNPYYMYMTYHADGYWDLKVDPATPEDVRVKKAKQADWAAYSSVVQGTYTGSGGQQNPNYFGTNKVGFLMMNTTVNGDDSYKDWMIMDCYGGNDVGGAVAFGISRTSGRVFYMGSAAARSSWSWDGEFITDGNIGSQHVRSAWYTKATNTYEGNTIISTSTTAEALFNNESLMSCAFMNYGDPFDTYADVIYYSGYQHWGGTQIATEYNTRYKPRMAIRKYSQTVGGWGSWGYIHTNHLSYIYGSSLPTSGMATGDIFYLIN